MNQSTMSSSYSQDFPKSSANVYFEVAHPFRIASIHSPNPVPIFRLHFRSSHHYLAVFNIWIVLFLFSLDK
ncbi:hypothetical protein RB195_015390 [Necator americanus]|uniref:Uncharacterized protein n=1 Tax=Necator americanus TaxID=51031 RepID=A0ABR1E4C8_NECAM